NYPAWIAGSEVVIRDHRGRVQAIVPIAPNGEAGWQMPADGEGDYFYQLRVRDSDGRRDETRAGRLSRVAVAEAPALTGPVVAAGEGDDMTARRGIPVRGGAVTVSGNAGGADRVTVLGEAVPVDPSGRFVVQRIL